MRFNVFLPFTKKRRNRMARTGEKNLSNKIRGEQVGSKTWALRVTFFEWWVVTPSHVMVGGVSFIKKAKKEYL